VHPRAFVYVREGSRARGGGESAGDTSDTAISERRSMNNKDDANELSRSLLLSPTTSRPAEIWISLSSVIVARPARRTIRRHL